MVSIPMTIEKLRDLKTIMCDFVALDERVRFLPQGLRKDHWVQEFIKNNFTAGTANLFQNQATFGNVLDEMRALFLAPRPSLMLPGKYGAYLLAPCLEWSVACWTAELAPPALIPSSSAA